MNRKGYGLDDVKESQGFTSGRQLVGGQSDFLDLAWFRVWPREIEERAVHG